MLFSTLLTLFVVPAAYILVDRISTLAVQGLRGLGGGQTPPALDRPASDHGDA
jgi:hypothetical protein